MQKSPKIYYRAAGGRYFKIVTPYSTKSSAEKFLVLHPDVAESIGCILSSSLSFWYYQVFSDNLNWKSYEITSFGLPPLTKAVIGELRVLYKRYLDDVERHACVRESAGKSSYKVGSFKEYKIGYSKQIIDEIDDLIGPLYGLTKEEIDFIKNYEIEFRMADYASSEEIEALRVQQSQDVIETQSPRKVKQTKSSQKKRDDEWMD